MTDDANNAIRAPRRQVVSLDFPQEVEQLHAWWRWAGRHGAIVQGTAWAKEFRAFGEQSRIAFPPAAIDRPDLMEIGDNVHIEAFASLSALPYHRDTTEAVLRIYDGVMLGRANQVLGSLLIEIGPDTVTSSLVTFVDSVHRYNLANIPVAHQGNLPPKPIRIGRGCLIQTGAVILGGVTLGDYVTVAANSLVAPRKEAFPANCLLAGYPARVIQQHG